MISGKNIHPCNTVEMNLPKEFSIAHDIAVGPIWSSLEMIHTAFINVKYVAVLWLDFIIIII